MDNVVEILPHVYQLRGSVGDRPLYQYLLVGDIRALLVDTGTTNTPAELIVPALAELGVAPEMLQFAVITHSDIDHQGGARQLKTLLPHVLLGCGEVDRRLVEYPERVIGERYDAYHAAHGITYAPETFAWMRSVGGYPERMDLTWTSGERIRLGSEWVVQLLQMPGHSPGHLVVYDQGQSAVFMGDAVHHVGYPGSTGRLALPPTYEQVGSYLQTIRQLEMLRPDLLAGGHWPVAREAEVAEFLSESRRYVEMADRLVRATVQAAPEGITLWELVCSLSPHLGDWPDSVRPDLAASLAGHLRYLERLGLVGSDPVARPVRFHWVGSGQ